jgi:hypothetical protein
LLANIKNNPDICKETNILKLFFRERDRSGTTEGQTKCSPKVMERIARRARGEASRSGSPQKKC